MGFFMHLAKRIMDCGGKAKRAPASLRELTEPNDWVHFFASQAPLPLTIAD